MADFTPLMRRTINLETAVSGEDILGATAVAIDETKGAYRLLPREGSDDGVALIYIKVHSTDKLNEIVVIPSGEDSVGYFLKNDQQYFSLAVALHAMDGNAPEQDDDILRFIEHFAEDLRDALYDSHDSEKE